MKGHIRKRGKDSWSIVLDLGRDANGKRRQKWHTVRGTKRDAHRELARLLTEINTGCYVEPSRVRLSEYLERWLRDYAWPRVSPKTLERYTDICRKNIGPAIGGYELSKLKPLVIQSFYTEALTNGRKDGKGGLSEQTVLHFHRVLHKALAQAVRWQLLARNPADAVDPPVASRREMQVLDDTGVAELLDVLSGTRLLMPTVMAVTTGMRRGEVLALRWLDVDLDKCVAIVARSLEQTRDGLRFKEPKTGRSSRSVALMAYTVEVLWRQKAELAAHRLALGGAYEDHGLVCARPDGRPWPPNTFSTAFAAAMRSSGLSVMRFHDLRHTHATLLLKQGVHPKVVSERLGHSKVGITLDTYSHVLPGMQEEAVSRLDTALQSAISANSGESQVRRFLICRSQVRILPGSPIISIS